MSNRSSTGERIVVLGVGNVLLRDDGVGIRVIEALQRLATTDPTALPAGTCLVDGGTLGVELLRSCEGARAVLIVDGVDLGDAPGTVSVMRGHAITSAGGRERGGPPGAVAELLALGRLMGWLPAPVALVGIQVHEVAFDLGLSPAVQAAVPHAVETVRRVLRDLEAEASDADALPSVTRRTLSGAGA